MMPPKILVAALAVLAALPFLGGCQRPTNDALKLKAIKSESQALMKAYPADAHVSVPKVQWPRVIASFEPEFVSISPAGVEITTKPHFDGGWGYFVPRNERELPEPIERLEEVGQGVYWSHPY